MENRPEMDALLQRLQLLERRQRHWSRLALVLTAVSLLAFVGWAPFDKVQSPTSTAARSADAALPTSDATRQPVDEPPTSEAPSVLDALRDESESGQPQSELTDAGDDFKSYTHREGDEAYLPSRMEWISLRGSAELPRGGGPNDGYGIMYGPDGKGSNTIRVLCTYDSKRVNRKQMEGDLKYIEMQLAGLAKLHGWDWLKIRIEARAVN